MDENNPIEGLDPSQSVFEPLMDQTMPEGVEGMRTTTTTTMYISGDENALENQRLQQTTTKPVDDPFGILESIKNFRLYQQSNNISANVGDINKLFPKASLQEKRQVLALYPDQFKEDVSYNNRILETYNELLDKGMSINSILEEMTPKLGTRSGLMARFPDLFSESDIEKDKAKQFEQQKQIEENNKKQRRINEINKIIKSKKNSFGDKLSFNQLRILTD